MKADQLEERLIQFSVDVIHLAKKGEKSFEADHLKKQWIRSATSCALNYGEARSAESTRDFIHKMKLCLKELRESLINIKIQHRAQLIKDNKGIEKIKKENDELISIFVASIKTSTNKINNLSILYNI